MVKITHHTIGSHGFRGSACKVQAEVGVHIRPDGKYVTNYELVGK